MDVLITPLREEDKQDWIDMWPDYADLEPPSQDLLSFTFSRLLDADQNPYGLFLRDKKTERLLGFLHYVLHDSSWTQRKICYMEDVYILPDYRRQGYFKELYSAFRAKGKEDGWSIIHWMIPPDNKVGRQVYDSIASQTNWIRYEDRLNR